MTIIKPGSIILVPLPFSDLTQTKQRPAVVISSSWYNTVKSDVIFAAITSSVRLPLELDEILIQGAEINSSGLAKESIVKTGNIYTIQKSLVIKSIGQLNRALFEKVMASVSHCLANLKP